MNWTDTFRAKALATLAERTAAARRIFAASSSTWGPQDAWLNRAGQRRDNARPAPVRDPTDSTR